MKKPSTPHDAKAESAEDVRQEFAASVAVKYLGGMRKNDHGREKQTQRSEVVIPSRGLLVQNALVHSLQVSLTTKRLAHRRFAHDRFSVKMAFIVV